MAVDYFALGILSYEFMMGKRPYSGKNRKEIRDQIFKEQITLKKSDIPEGWSVEAADFINKCL
jgi:serine/threonine protein kinase